MKQPQTDSRHFPRSAQIRRAMRHCCNTSLGLALLALIPARAIADPPTLRDLTTPTLAEVFDRTGIFVAGYAAAGYTAGLNKGEAFSGRVFETVASTNTFQFNQAALVLARVPDEGFGGKVLAVAGTDAKIFNAFYGSPLNDYALFIAEVDYFHGPLQVTAGRFPALSGYELAPIALNDNLSRSLLLALAQPVPLTGVRLTYKFTSELTGVLAVSNSDVIDASASFGTPGGTSAAAVDDNKQKALEFGGSYAPIKAFKLAIYDYYSVESQANGGKNDILDLVATYQATSALQFAFNGDYLRTYNTTPVTGGHLFAGDATIKTGGDGYINYKWSPHISTSLRLEYLRIKDKQGTPPDLFGAGGTDGSVNYLSEATLTGRYTFDKNFRLLAEARGDRSTAPFFANGATPAKHDTEFRLEGIYSFGGL